MTAHPTDSIWIRELRLSPCARAQLVCFPHAGGTANFFRNWSRALPWDVDLLALQYPGREERFGGGSPGGPGRFREIPGEARLRRRRL